MAARAMIIAVWEIFYEDSTSEIASFTKMEWASFKRTKKFKTVLSKKRLCAVELKIKTK